MINVDRRVLNFLYEYEYASRVRRVTNGSATNVFLNVYECR